MSKIIEQIKTNLRQASQSPKIIFPEGHHEYVEAAALKLVSESKIEPILVVKTKEEVKDNGLTYIAMDGYDNENEMIELLVELRKAKGMTAESAKQLIASSNYFATMLVKMNLADGYVGGIEYTTADTLRPALQIIKTAPGTKIVSSVFIMEKGEERYLFSDCAINLDPTAEQVSEIAKQTMAFGKSTAYMDEIRAGLLSYSTDGSGKGPDADKMDEAYNLTKDHGIKNAEVFGSIQFDAAFSNDVMKKKVKSVSWDKPVNTFIFPNLSSGNIGYKIAQRMGGYDAIGPILTGLAAPVNDLSRGASIEDIVKVTFITASQVVALKESE